MAEIRGKKTLAEMAAEVRAINTEKGWRTGGNTFGDYIALIHSELSEALEAYRDYRLADATDTERWNAAGLPKPEGVGSEFADVLIRLVDVADIYGIDLEAEYERKVAYNRTRPYQHGGRTLSEATPAEDTRIDGSDLPKLCGHGIDADCECRGDDQPTAPEVSE